MDPKQFEHYYIRVDFLENELSKMLKEMEQLDYHSLNDYDKGGFDGYNQGITELLKKLDNRKNRKIN